MTTQPLSAYTNKQNLSESVKQPLMKHTMGIATPDTEDELEKEIEFIVNPQPELSEMLEGNFTKLFKQLQKDLIRKLIRTEKLKVVGQVKLEKEDKSFISSAALKGDEYIHYSGIVDGHNLAVDDLNAIREKLRKNI